MFPPPGKTPKEDTAAVMKFYKLPKAFPPAVLAEAKRQKAQILRLHAQTQAVPFYEHFGFHTVGEVFIEADLPHIMMEMAI